MFALTYSNSDREEEKETKKESRKFPGTKFSLGRKQKKTKEFLHIRGGGSVKRGGKHREASSQTLQGGQLSPYTANARRENCF